jgi:hypothetical protein
MKLFKSAALAADRRLIADWRRQVRRLWTAQIALLWIVLAALIFVAPMVSDEAKALVGAGPFAGGLFLASVSLGIARLLKQPGATDD